MTVREDERRASDAVRDSVVQYVKESFKSGADAVPVYKAADDLKLSVNAVAFAAARCKMTLIKVMKDNVTCLSPHPSIRTLWSSL